MQLTDEQIRLIQNYFTDKPVKRAYVFGSYATNEATKNSDVDLLVELDSQKLVGMIEYIKMMDSLESVLNKKVDMVTTDGVSAFIKPFIDKSKVLIYEA